MWQVNMSWAVRCRIDGDMKGKENVDLKQNCIFNISTLLYIFFRTKGTFLIDNRFSTLNFFSSVVSEAFRAL